MLNLTSLRFLWICWNNKTGAIMDHFVDKHCWKCAKQPELTRLSGKKLTFLWKPHWNETNSTGIVESGHSSLGRKWQPLMTIYQHPYLNEIVKNKFCLQTRGCPKSYLQQDDTCSIPFRRIVFFYFKDLIYFLKPCLSSGPYMFQLFKTWCKWRSQGTFSELSEMLKRQMNH